MYPAIFSPHLVLPGNALRAKPENAKVARQVRSSAGLAVFVSARDDRAHWVEAGRCYQRFALQATALGIRNAFVNQPVEVAAVRAEFARTLGLGTRRPSCLVARMATTIVALALLLASTTTWSAGVLVLQSDFGTADGAVASMRGVAVGVSRDLAIYDLTHEIPAFNIWEASLRLDQTASYWPEGTVFVSVVDPGVGTERRSVVLKTRSGHYFVSPDNGSLTAVAESLGVEAVRAIDEAVNRLADSAKSYTFHGRDVYAYTGARLAAGIISFTEVGRELPAEVVMIPYQRPGFDNGRVAGNIEILDPNYGNIWTNIHRTTFSQLNLAPGDRVTVVITHDGERVLQHTLPFHRTFGEVAVGETLLYLNSQNKVSLAINQGNFATTHDIRSGPRWDITITRAAD